MITEESFNDFMETTINSARMSLPFPLWVYVAEQRIYGGVWMLAYSEDLPNHRVYELMQVLDARIAKEAKPQ